MRTAWWTALRFAAGGAAVLSVAYGISEAVDPVYPVTRVQMEIFQARSDEAEVVTVGNSHSLAVDLDVLDLRGAHLWTSGQDAFEAAYLARYAADEAPRLRYVLLTASYGFQRVDHAVITSRDLTGRRRELYARTPLLRPIAGDLDLWVSGKLAPLVRTDHWYGVLARLRRPRRPVRMGPDGSPPEALRPSLTPDALRRHAVERGERHRSMTAATLARAPETPAHAVAEIDRLAADLRDHGVMLILYTPPYHESYLHEQDPTVVAETRALLTGVLRRNPNAVWLNFSTDPAFIRSDSLFRDSDHMNRAGARIFSAMLRRCLDSLGAGSRPVTPIRRCPAVGAPVASGERTTGPAASPSGSAAAAPTTSPAERRDRT